MRLTAEREERLYERRRVKAGLTQDIYQRQTAEFREWQPQEQLEGLSGVPRETPVMKILYALTWIGVVVSIGGAYQNWTGRRVATNSFPEVQLGLPPARHAANAGAATSLPLHPAQPPNIGAVAPLPLRPIPQSFSPQTPGPQAPTPRTFSPQAFIPQMGIPQMGIPRRHSIRWAVLRRPFLRRPSPADGIPRRPVPRRPVPRRPVPRPQSPDGHAQIGSPQTASPQTTSPQTASSQASFPQMPPTVPLPARRRRHAQAHDPASEPEFAHGPNALRGRDPHEAIAERGHDGSFSFDAIVNGSHVQMMFDTGASLRRHPRRGRARDWVSISPSSLIP